jgi:hypothetical protein
MELTSRSTLSLLSKAKSHVRVVQTYFLTKSHLELGVYTDTEGRCRRMKFKEPKTIAEVLTELLHNSSSSKKVCYAYKRRTRTLLTTEDIEALLNNQRLQTFTSFQSYIEPWSEAEAPQKISVRLQHGSYVSEYTQFQGLRHLAEMQMQQKMMEIAKKVMHCVLEVERKPIESLELEFIQDYNRQLWLVDIPDCRFAVKAIHTRVGINRSIVSYEGTVEAMAPQIAITRALHMDLNASLENTPRNEESSPVLPMITRIYQKHFARERPRFTKSISTSKIFVSKSPRKEDSVIGSSASIIAKSVFQQDSMDQSLLKHEHSVLKELYTKVGGSPHNELTEVVSDSEIQYLDARSPVMTEPVEAVAVKSRELPKQALRKSSQVRSYVRSPKTTQVSKTIYSSMLNSNLLIDQLAARRQELHRKYGSYTHLQRAALGIIKTRVLSPYANRR